MFEILFDWIREGRRIPILGDGANRYQLLAVEDLVDAIVRCLDAPVAGEALNVGAARFGTVREDLEDADRPCGLGLAALPRARRGRRRSRSAASSSRGSRRSPSGTTARRTRTRSSSIDKARELLGWEPRLSNAETLCATYDWYLAHRTGSPRRALTHRVPWDQRALGVLKRLA